MMIRKQLPKLSVTIAYLAIVGLLFVEGLTYKGVLRNYLGIEAWILLVVFFSILLMIRSRFTKRVPNWFVIPINNKLVLPAVTTMGLFLYGLESWNYTNYVFSTLRINHYIFVELFLFSFFFLVFTISKTMLKKFWISILFVGFLSINFHIYAYNPILFAEMSLSVGSLTDDNFMEWLQVVVLLVGAGISMALAVRTKNDPLLRLLYIVCTLGLFFFLGEEISWGERFLPFSFQQNSTNYQNEFNLHNQPGLNELAAVLYAFAGIYAFSSWLLRKMVESSTYVVKRLGAYWDIFCFKAQVALFFVPTLIGNPYADRTIINGYPPLLDLYYSWGIIPDFFSALRFLSMWRETFEVLFYMAFVLHLFEIYTKLPRIQRRTTPR